MYSHLEVKLNTPNHFYILNSCLASCGKIYFEMNDGPTACDPAAFLLHFYKAVHQQKIIGSVLCKMFVKIELTLFLILNLVDKVLKRF